MVDIATSADQTTALSPSGATTAGAAYVNVGGGLRKITMALLGASIGFLQSGTGASTRAMQDKVREVVSLPDFYASGDGSDYTPALARAIAAKPKEITIPSGTYTFLTATDIAAKGPIHIKGAAPATTGDGATVIQANAGFLMNSTTTRQTLCLRNLHIKGNSTAGTFAIDGPFGGYFKDCHFEAFPILVSNLSSYLTRYIRCAFTNADTGLMLADTNGVKVEDCHFDSNCSVAIDNITGTPQSGANTGNPFQIIGNNFNIGFATNLSKVQVRGNILFYANYFEDFSSVASGYTMLDYTAGRFDNMGLMCFSNEFNGQSMSLNAIRIGGTNAGLSAPCNGAIFSNRILGVTNGITVGTNNIVTGLRVFDNGGTNTYTNLSPTAVYRPLANMEFNGATAITGTTYVDLPMATTTDFDNAAGSGVAANSYRIRKTGIYKIDCNLTFQNTDTTTSLRNIDFQMLQGATQIAHGWTNIPVAAASAPQFAAASMTALVSCTAGQDIKVQARNGGVTGGSAFNGQMTIIYLGDGNA